MASTEYEMSVRAAGVKAIVEEQERLTEEQLDIGSAMAELLKRQIILANKQGALANTLRNLMVNV